MDSDCEPVGCFSSMFSGFIRSRINDCFNINPTKPIMIIQNHCLGLWLWAASVRCFPFIRSRINECFSTANNPYLKSLFRIVIVSQWAASVRCFPFIHSRINECFSTANNPYLKSLFRIVSQWAASVPYFRASSVPGSMIASAPPIMIIQNQCFRLWASELLQFDVFRSCIPGLTNVSAPPIILF